jgi:hypothetical protein
MEEFKLQSLKLGDKNNKLDYVADLCIKVKQLFPNAVFTDTVEQLMDKINDESKDCNKEIDIRLTQLKSTLGRYWEVTCTDEDNNYEYWQFLIYPYRIIMSNDTYWFVKGYTERDSYHSGMHDDNINFMDCWTNNNISFKEITKEEFLKRINEHTNDVLDYRLNKIKECYETNKPSVEWVINC